VGASNPPAVTLSLIAPSDGATVGVRGIVVLGRVDPPTAVVLVAGRRVRVVHGVFSRPLQVQGRSRRIAVSARASGYIGTTIETTVAYSPALHAALGHAARSAGNSSRALNAAAAVVVRQGSQSSTSLDTPANQSDFMSGCAASGRTSAAGCECLYRQIVAQPELVPQLEALIQKVESTGAMPSADSIPASIRTAVLACAPELG
jgi:hypothetical protein